MKRRIETLDEFINEKVTSSDNIDMIGLFYYSKSQKSQNPELDLVNKVLKKLPKDLVKDGYWTLQSIKVPIDKSSFPLEEVGHMSIDKNDSINMGGILFNKEDFNKFYQASNIDEVKSQETIREIPLFINSGCNILFDFRYNDIKKLDKFLYKKDNWLFKDDNGPKFMIQNFYADPLKLIYDKSKKKWLRTL